MSEDDDDMPDMTDEEKRLTADMPPQVRGGFLRAYRKDHPRKLVDREDFTLEQFLKDLSAGDA